MPEKPWTYVETRTRIKGTNEFYKIKVDLEDLGLLKDKNIVIAKNLKLKLGMQVCCRDIIGGFVDRSKQVTVARFILNLDLSTKSFIIEYLNNDPLDLRKSNLRVITPNELIYKCKNQKRSSILPRGVYIIKNSIFSQICINKKMTYLGTFDTVEEASQAYQKAKKEIIEVLESVNFNV